MNARDAATQPDFAALARALYTALDGIYVEELNGRLCAMPETLPDPFGDEGPRESRCCPACRRHWERTTAALSAYREAMTRG